MLTKKHFEAIADILNRHLELERTNVTKYLLINIIAADLGAYFDSENDRFDLARFLNRVQGVKR
jgi:hypothetical protein